MQLVTSERQRKFETVLEAHLALGLAGEEGSIYYGATNVFIVTPIGFGRFTREEWDRECDQNALTRGISLPYDTGGRYHPRPSR